MEKENLDQIVKRHAEWLIDKNVGEAANLRGAVLSGAKLCAISLNKACFSEAALSGADFSEADLSGADFSGADLSFASFHEANLSGANLRKTNLSGANLRETNLSRADLSEADLRGVNFRGANLRAANLSKTDLRGACLYLTNLSETIGLLVPSEYLQTNFEKTPDGIIVYKAFGLYCSPSTFWKIQVGTVITEICNPCRTTECGSGINVATLTWLNKAIGIDNKIWKCLIRWEWLSDVVVPYNTSGKIRAGKIELLERIEKDFPFFTLSYA